MNFKQNELKETHSETCYSQFQKTKTESRKQPERSKSPHTKDPQLDILIIFLIKALKTRNNGQMHSKCWKEKTLLTKNSMF